MDSTVFRDDVAIVYPISIMMNPRIQFFTRMLMIKDGLCCAMRGHEKLLGQQAKMEASDLRQARRRFRKAWRAADKKKALRWREADVSYTGGRPVPVPENIRIERTFQVYRYYRQKAKEIMRKSWAETPPSH